MRGRSSPLLGVCLKLRFERGELGERRVRIGFLLATVAAVPALDVFRAQFGITVRAVAAVGTAPALVVGPVAALVTILPIWASLASLASLAFAARLTIGPLAARLVGAIVVATLAAPLMVIARLLIRCGLALARRCGQFGHCRRTLAVCRNGRGLCRMRL